MWALPNSTGRDNVGRQALAGLAGKVQVDSGLVHAQYVRQEESGSAIQVEVRRSYDVAEFTVPAPKA